MTKLAHYPGRFPVDSGEAIMLALCTMPIMRSAAKRMRADRKRHERNLQAESELKGLTRKLRKLIEAGQPDPARALFQILSKRLDQAAKRQIIHRNTASRNKSRLARHLAKLR